MRLVTAAPYELTKMQKRFVSRAKATGYDVDFDFVPRGGTNKCPAVPLHVSQFLGPVFFVTQRREVRGNMIFIYLTAED